MTVKTVDRRSYDLAAHFLQGTEGEGSEKITMKLAQEIQSTVEDFLPDVSDPDLRRMMEAHVEPCPVCNRPLEKELIHDAFNPDRP